MKTIYKYAIEGGDAEIMLPKNAEILHFAFQERTPTLWARVDTDEPLQGRRFKVVGTGWEFKDWASHVGTVLEGPFVWHCFEINTQ